MQTEGLNFKTVQKSLVRIGMSKINEQKQSEMKIRADLQTTKYLVFSMVLKDKMSSI